MSHKLRIGMTHRRSHIEGPGMQGMKGKAYGYWQRSDKGQGKGEAKEGRGKRGGSFITVGGRGIGDRDLLVVVGVKRTRHCL